MSFSDTPGGVPRVEDQLGCGVGQTVSDMEQALLERIVEWRQSQGAHALQVNGALMLAARDAALQLQGSLPYPPAGGDFPTILASFGYRGQNQAVLILPPSSGVPTAPADPSSIVVDLPWTGAARDTLKSTEWNEVGASVMGSCYRLGAVVVLGYRKAAPGPNP
jgi:hypothetical protein